MFRDEGKYLVVLTMCNRDGLVSFLYACTSDNNNGMRLSSLRIWFLLAVSYQHLTGWKAMWSGYRFIMQNPGQSSGFIESKAG